MVQILFEVSPLSSCDRKSITVSRETLYKQVWETPMVRLAEQYGISGNGLAKACRRLGVPYPGRGYWRKKETNKKVRAARLSASRGKFPETTMITPISDHPKPSSPPPERAERQAAILRLAREMDIRVPDRVGSLHPAVAPWRNRRLRKYGNAGLTPARRRQYRLLHALFTALEKRGGVGKWRDHRWYDSRRQRSVEGEAYILMGKEPIHFEMREIVRDEKRLYTEEERKNVPSHCRYAHNYVPTGRFRFAITTNLPAGWNAIWRETDEQPMDAFLGEIAATCILVRPELERQRLAEEREARRTRIAEERERRRKRRRQLDNERWESFVAFAKHWAKLRKVRGYLDALRAEGTDPREPFGKRDVREWLAWAENRLLQEEARCGRQAVFGRLAGMRLEEDGFARRLYALSRDRR